MSKQFPKGFLWGSASSAYQIEGAYQTDNKGPSIWDIYANEPGNTFQDTNGNTACDHYHRFREDIALMHEMGLKAYRFSISWPRILPQGRGKVNESGIRFYEQLIDELLDNGIEPVVTLYHWDLPQTLQNEYGGWESRKIIDDFVAFCDTCFRRFHGKIQYWIVMNEPNIFTQLGYLLAMHPPKKSDLQLYLNTFHMSALAHHKTVCHFKKMGYQGKIGSSIAYTPGYKASEDTLDDIALQNYYDTNCWWFMDAYFKGDYPENGVRLMEEMGCTIPMHEEDRSIFLEGASLCDFIGINYYQSAMIAHNPTGGVGLAQLNTTGVKGLQQESGVPGLYKQIRNPNIEYTDWDWAIDPVGLTKSLVELTNKYHLPILISENGLGAFDEMVDGRICDKYRIDYLHKHIDACYEAINQGVTLIGYCTWSFTDLLSWLNGYQKRYGFVYIDFEDESLQRVRKYSFYWYQNVIRNNGLEEKN